MEEKDQTSIVRIYSKSSPIGCGFLVDGGSVLTCRHVIRDALKPETDLLGKEVDLDYPFSKSSDHFKAKVNLVAEKPDLARLELLSDPPETSKPMPLSTDIIREHPYSAWGIVIGRSEGFLTNGVIKGKIPDGTIQLEGKSEFKVEQGFSGTAVWDEEIKKAVGMVVKTETDPGKKVSYAIPMDIILENCPELIDKSLRTGIGEFGKLNNVPELPASFLPREKDFKKVKEALLSEDERTVGITGQKAGLQGMGGAGKTVLAIALARDENIRKHFVDGVFWLTMGQKQDLVERQRQLAKGLGELQRSIVDVQDGRSCLSDLLAKKVCLIVLDDIWDARQIHAFNVLGPRCRMLITTRKAELIREEFNYKLDVMNDNEALELLAMRAGQKRADLPASAKDVAKECGNLPLALAMAGAMVRGRPERLEIILHRLRNADLSKIRTDFADYPYPDLFLAMEVSVEDLNLEDKDRYLDLAIFPEDTPVPQSTLETFWEPEGLNRDDVSDLIYLLVDSSLARLERNGLILHDLQRDYVKKRTTDLKAIHNRLLQSYWKKCLSGWPSAKDDGYFFYKLAYHLMEAGRQKDLCDLLLKFDWLQTKLNITNVNALISDYDYISDDKHLELIKKAIRISAHILAKDRTQLQSQLYGRLMNSKSHIIQQMISTIREMENKTWLYPLTPSLISPDDPLVEILKEDSPFRQDITYLASTPDGSIIISASSNEEYARFDNQEVTYSIKVWDLKQIKLLRKIEAFKENIGPIALMPDGKTAIISIGKRLEIWNIEGGKRVAPLGYHNDRIIALSLSANGKRAVSVSWDSTLKSWDLEKSREISSLSVLNPDIIAINADCQRGLYMSHSGSFAIWDINNGKVIKKRNIPDDEQDKRLFLTAALSSDAKRVFLCEMNKIGIWDIDKEKEIGSLEGHPNNISAIAVSSNANLLFSSAVASNSIFVYDLGKNIERKLKGHINWITALSVSSNEKYVVSGDADRKIKVWDSRNGEELYSLDGEGPVVDAIAISPDSKYFFSASKLGKLKLYDLELRREIASLDHDDHTYAAAFTLDGKHVISIHPNQINILEVESEKNELHSKDLPISLENLFAVSPAGFIISTINNLINVWNFNKGWLQTILDGHGGPITSIALTPNGLRLISASTDKSCKVWDLETGKELAAFDRHDENVYIIATSPDGFWAASVSTDNVFGLWKIEDGESIGYAKIDSKERIRSFNLNKDATRAILLMKDAIEVWDLGKSTKIACFSGDTSFTEYCLLPKSDIIAIGELSGRMHFLRFKSPTESLISFSSD
jgi:WD40 repeat protein